MKKGQRIQVKNGEHAGCLGTIVKGRIHLGVELDGLVNYRSTDGYFYYSDTELTAVDTPKLIALYKMADLANKFHRRDECGSI